MFPSTWRFCSKFVEGNKSNVTALGGKGANLAEMCKMGLPVPPGFTLPTAYSVNVSADKEAYLTEAFNQISNGYTWLVDVTQDDSLLVSVRSGAAISMPGMMDTILNVGMTDEKVLVWQQRIGKRAAYDSYRRLIQMLGSTAFGIAPLKFEKILDKARTKDRADTDAQITEATMVSVVKDFLKLYLKETGDHFPQTVGIQLQLATKAVFDSWNNQRAIDYRNIQGISHDIGTAVTVQAMVFGNMNDNSGSGVLFTRNPKTGADEIFGEFLPNAQGEDVVAGIRTPLPLSKLSSEWPAVASEIADMCATLEHHYLDMMDVEFTVQDGKLWILQCRVGKRSDLAAVVIAAALHKAGKIDLPTALSRLTRKKLRMALQAQVNPSFKVEPAYTGLGSNVGIAKGVAVGTANEAVASKVPCILVRDETDPDDILGMNAAAGILTCTGGTTSHAAVVARAMNKPCVVGCTSLKATIKDILGKQIVLDGSTGRVWVEQDVPVIGGSLPPEVIYLARQVAPDMRLCLTASEMPWQSGDYGKVLVSDWANGYAPSADMAFDLGHHESADDADLEALFATAPVDLLEIPIVTAPSTKVVCGPALKKFLNPANKYLGEATTFEEMLDSRTLTVSKNVEAGFTKSQFTKLCAALADAGFTKGELAAQPPVYILMHAIQEG